MNTASLPFLSSEFNL